LLALILVITEVPNNMKNIKLIFIITILMGIISCEKDEEPQTFLVDDLVGDYINTEWTFHLNECDDYSRCEWVFDTIYMHNPKYNIKIIRVENDKIEIYWGDSKIYAINFTKATNGIFGQIPLQNQLLTGEIRPFEGYHKWGSYPDFYSICYQDGLIDMYYIVDEIMLVNIQGVKQ
jgi:hypothetical protein